MGLQEGEAPFSVTPAAIAFLQPPSCLACPLLSGAIQSSVVHLWHLWDSAAMGAVPVGSGSVACAGGQYPSCACGCQGSSTSSLNTPHPCLVPAGRWWYPGGLKSQAMKGCRSFMDFLGKQGSGAQSSMKILHVDRGLWDTDQCLCCLCMWMT